MSPAWETGLVDRLETAGLTRQELQELAAALELAASAVRTIMECSEGEEGKEWSGTARNFAALLDALGMTTADLSGVERSTLASLAGDERARVRALLCDFLDHQAQDPSLYDDRGDRPGAGTAAVLVDQLWTTRQLAILLRDQLAAATSLSSQGRER